MFEHFTHIFVSVKDTLCFAATPYIPCFTAVVVEAPSLSFVRHHRCLISLICGRKLDSTFLTDSIDRALLGIPYKPSLKLAQANSNFTRWLPWNVLYTLILVKRLGGQRRLTVELKAFLRKASHHAAVNFRSIAPQSPHRKDGLPYIPLQVLGFDCLVSAAHKWEMPPHLENLVLELTQLTQGKLEKDSWVEVMDLRCEFAVMLGEQLITARKHLNTIRFQILLVVSWGSSLRLVIGALRLARLMDAGKFELLAWYLDLQYYYSIWDKRSPDRHPYQHEIDAVCLLKTLAF